MWILFRILVAVGAFIYRLINRFLPKYTTKEYSNTPLYTSNYKKGEQIFAHKAGFSLKSNFIFKFSKETSTDKFFKKTGLSTEFSTGDKSFDKKVYIASDHPQFHLLIKKNKEIRNTILELFSLGIDSVFADGKIIWITKKEGYPVNKELGLLLYLQSRLSKLIPQTPGILKDKFVIRTILIEALIWSLLAYAISGSYTYYSYSKYSDLYPDVLKLIILGLGIALIIFMALFGLIFILLKGSSKGHRIIIESGIVLILALPANGIIITSDLNINLDSQKADIIYTEIMDIEIIEHPRTRTRNWYSYHLIVNNRNNILPTSIQINYAKYKEAIQSKKAEFHIGKGWLGIPWYKDIIFH